MTPRVNPVLGRELTQRMRGRSSWIILLLYLALLALILRMVYGAIGDGTVPGRADVLGAASAGRAIFHWMLFFILALVCFIVPGVTAGAIAGERERQTLVSLQVTMLRPSAIVSGKLWASLAYMLLLIVATLPLLGVTLVVGGVSLTEVIAGLAMVLLTAVALASVAIAASAVFRRTQAATVVSYGITVLLVIGTFVVYGFQAVVARSEPEPPAPAVLALNPFVATADVVRGRSLDRSIDSPFVGLQSLIGEDEPVFVDRPVPIGPDGRLAEGAILEGGDLSRPRTILGARIWVVALLGFGALSLASVALAVRRVTVPRQGVSD